MQTLVFITSLTFIPAILLMMTSFTRIIIVLVYCVTRWERPPRHLTGIAGAGTILTFYYVTGDRQNLCRCVPAIQRRENINAGGAGKGAQPLREFMLRQTREADLGLFARLANTGPLQGPEAVPMRILLPAYVTSELKTAFQIGFTIFIPF